MNLGRPTRPKREAPAEHYGDGRHDDEGEDLNIGHGLSPFRT